MEAAKFVRDFKSLAKEANEFLGEHKALEFEIDRLLKAVVSQDIMSIVQSNSVVDTSNIQTELDQSKCDKISYDKAYNDMQQKIKWLQAQLGDQKGKSKDTSCVSDTLDPLSQKLENENVELDFPVLNYAKENEHLKTTYKILFDSINMTRAQTKTITDSLQQKLHDTIYENAKLRAQLFDKVSEQKDTTKGTSTNTKFANQSTKRKPSLKSLRNNFVVKQPNAFQSERPNTKFDKTNALSNPSLQLGTFFHENQKGVQTVKVIASRIFRIIILRPLGVNNTAKTLSPQPARVHSKSKSSCLSNNFKKLEENHRNSLIPKTQKHKSSECNNIKLAVRNAKSEVVCAMCVQPFLSAFLISKLVDIEKGGRPFRFRLPNTNVQLIESRAKDSSNSH
ncbi:hypothetical protein Tco_1403143 [Tanacetum coccineum]